MPKSEGPSLTELKKRLKLGQEISLPDGRTGIFLSNCVKSKTHAWILLDEGGKITDSIENILRATWGYRK